MFLLKMSQNRVSLNIGTDEGEVAEIQSVNIVGNTSFFR